MVGLRRVFGLIAGGTVAIAAWAQSPQALEAESQRQQRQAQQRADERARQQSSDVDVRWPDVPKAPVRQPLVPNESPCFTIRSVHIHAVGASSHDWSWLREHVVQPDDPGPLQALCLGAQAIGQIMARLQHTLVDRGWITTRITAPPQDLTTGELHLHVQEGVVSDIRLADGHAARATLFNTLPVHVGQLLNLRDLEQGLENFRRVPSVQADLAIEPGVAPGQSALVIRHEQAFPFRLHASIDDSGSDATGTFQGALTLRYDNWWTLSDVFYVTLQSDVGGKAPGPRGNRGRTLHYSVPWGYSLWAMNSTRSSYHQTVAGAFQRYLYSGQSEQHDVRVSRTVQRDQLGKTHVALRAFHRRSRNFIDDTEIDVQRRAVSGLDFSIGHRRSVGRGQWEATLTRRQGVRHWGALPAPEEAFGEGTARMRLWQFDASLSVPFVMGRQPWTYQGTWRQQSHHTSLTPQDRMAIGGRYTVRGFDGEQVLSGDSGVLMRHELETPLGQTPYRVYAGLDWGRVSGPSARQLVGRELMGAVVGTRANGRWGRARMELDVFVGHPIHSPDGFATRKPVYGFSLSTQF